LNTRRKLVEASALDAKYNPFWKAVCCNLAAKLSTWADERFCRDDGRLAVRDLLAEMGTLWGEARVSEFVSWLGWLLSLCGWFIELGETKPTTIDCCPEVASESEFSPSSVESSHDLFNSRKVRIAFLSPSTADLSFLRDCEEVKVSARERKHAFNPSMVSWSSLTWIRSDVRASSCRWRYPLCARRVCSLRFYVDNENQHKLPQ